MPGVRPEAGAAGRARPQGRHRLLRADRRLRLARAAEGDPVERGCAHRLAGDLAGPEEPRQRAELPAVEDAQLTCLRPPGCPLSGSPARAASALSGPYTLSAADRAGPA